MNAITKRLLSFVVVLAMVLAMAPAITLPAAAATTDSVEAWIASFEAAEAAGTIAEITTCPFCSGTEVTWTAKSGAVNGNQEANKFSGHYYLSDNYSASGSSRAIWLAGNACCYLNGYSVSNTSSAGYSLISTSGNTLNIFGDGEVTNSGSSWTFDFNGAGLVNIYGGTYTHNGTTADRLMFENNALAGVSTHAMIYGGKFNVNVGTYDEDNSYAYNNVQIAAGYEVTKNGDGTWTVAKPEPFVPPEICPCCNEAGADLTWQALDGTEGGQITNSSSAFDGATHFYLAKDITLTDVTYLFYRGAVSSCLYLNGKNLTYKGSSYVFHAAGQTMTICGDGNVTSTSASAMFMYNGAGGFKIYGGNYTYSGTGVMFNNTKAANTTLGTHAMIYGGTFNVNVGTYDEDQSTTTFNHVQIADGYDVTNNGNGTWTVAAHTHNWGEGVETTPATCTQEGTKTYTCSGCRETKTETIAKLDHDFSANGPTCANCEEVNPSYVEKCPGCGEIILPSAWEVYTGQHNVETALTSGHKHYKLAADYRYTTGYGLYVKGGTVCFDLGENTISRSSGSGATFQVDAGTLNVVGEGTAVGGQYGCVRTGSADATVNLKGGTFKKHTGYTTVPVVDLSAGGTVNLYDGATITTDGAENSRGGSCVHLRGTETNKAVFNMYGGVVTAGTGTYTVGSVNYGGPIATGRNYNSETSNAAVNILGGTVTGGTLPSGMHGDAIFVKKGTSLTVGGTATINGEIYLQSADASLTLKGTPTITAGGVDNAGIVLNGALANVDALEAGASIAVVAAQNEVLTAASENASVAATCFKLVDAESLIIEVNAANQLVVATLVKLPTTCPYCGGTLTNADWTPVGVSETSELYTFERSGHYYLESGFTSSYGGFSMRIADGDDTNTGRSTVCLYLNGNDITKTRGSNIFHARYDILNIWGEGTISNTATCTGSMFTYGGIGEVNIYGGEYVHNVADVSMFATNGFAIVGKDDEGNSYYQDNHVNVYGGSFNADLTKVNSMENGRYMVKAWNVSVVNGNSETVYADGAAAMAAYNGGYIRANQDAAVEIAEGKTAYIDNAGNRVTVTGKGTLCAMNSSGDDFATTSDLFLLGDDVQVVRDVTGGSNGYRYISIDGGTLDGMRILKPYRFELKIATVSLRPRTNSGMGMYYKAEISCGPELETELAKTNNFYGVVLSLQDMPGANFAAEKNGNGAFINGWTAIEGTTLGVNAENDWTVTMNSTPLFNVMVANANYAEVNQQRGTAPVYANAYVYIDFNDDGNIELDEFVMADTANIDKKKTDAGFNGIAWSLYDVVKAIDDRWDLVIDEVPAISEDAKTSVNNFYTYWSQFGMNAWKFTNIRANEEV